MLGWIIAAAVYVAGVIAKAVYCAPIREDFADADDALDCNEWNADYIVHPELRGGR